MPTARLYDDDRSRIHNDFARIARRGINSKGFPANINDDNFNDWAKGLLDPEVLDLWERLKSKAPKLANNFVGWRPEIRIRGSEFDYTLMFNDGKVPYNGIRVHSDHPDFSAIIQWANWTQRTESRIDKALHYLHTSLYLCHSFGQVERILPPEILKFAPQYLINTLREAERKSRIPAGFIPDEEKLMELADVLALGSLSPEERPGIDVSIYRKERIVEDIKGV